MKILHVGAIFRLWSLKQVEMQDQYNKDDASQFIQGV